MRRILLLLFSLVAVASPAHAQQTKFSSGTVLNVAPAISVSISIAPNTSQTVALSGTQVFTATVTNDPQNLGVGWNVSGTGFNCIFPACGSFLNTGGSSIYNGITASGAPLTYQAPSTFPTAPNVTITATSLADRSKSVQVQVVLIASGVSPPFIVNGVQTPPKQTAAAANTFPLTASQGNGYVIGIGTGMGATITSVTDPINGNWTSIGCQADFNGGAPGVHAAMFFIQNAQAGITNVTVNQTSPSSSETVVFFDLGNASPTSFFTTGLCNGSSTASTNPIASSLSTTAAQGQIIISYLSPFINCSGVANPYTFGTTPRGDAFGYVANPAIGSYAASFTCASGSYAIASALFQTGTSSGISVSLSPPTASVLVSTTAQFTASVVNDTAGVNLTYTGAGCSGATCGTGPATAASGVPFTYTAPASVPSPATVTITATSITNPAKSATSTVTVTAAPVVNVTMTPVNTSTTASGATVPLVPVVTNDPANKGVTMSIGSSCGASCGTLSATSAASGATVTYTPPVSLSSTQSVSITATSVADNTKSATSTIIVSPATSGFSCSGTNCPAFYGTFGNAEGSGATSVGGSGRGGTGTPVIWLITDGTDNSYTGSTTTIAGKSVPTGSLRACVEATGPRFCVPRVSTATTATKGRIQVNNPYITVLGQMVPGGGFVMHSAGTATCQSSSGCGAPFIATHDVIWRYMTYDGYAQTSGNPVDTGTVGFEMASGNIFNVYYDHITCRWWGNACPDELSNDAGNVHNTSVSNSAFYESNITHPIAIKLDTTGGDASLTCNLDWFRNWVANYDRRWGLLNICSTRWDNNYSFNGLQDGNQDYYFMAWGALKGDLIGNVYEDGPNSANVMHAFLFNVNKAVGDAANDCSPGRLCKNQGPPSIYALNNSSHICNQTANGCTIRTLITPTNVVNDTSELNQVFQGWEGGESTPPSGTIVGPFNTAWFRSTPLAAPQFPITIMPNAQVKAALLAENGNQWAVNCDGTRRNNQDSQDARVVAQIKAAGPGGNFNGPNYNGPPLPNPSPAIPAGTNCAMTMAVGLYDAWILKWNLPTNDPNLGTETDLSTGFLYVEDLANGLAPGHP